MTKNINIAALSCLLILMSACASKTTINMNASDDGLRIFRGMNSSQIAGLQLNAIGDIEHSSVGFSEEKAAEENMNYVKAEAKRVGATVLVINKAETKYNLLSAKYTVIINATVFK